MNICHLHCLTSHADSKILYRLETWAPDPDVPSTTLYLRQADAFQRGVARRIYRVAGGSEDRAGKIFLSPLSMPPGYQAPKKEVRCSILHTETEADSNI